MGPPVRELDPPLIVFDVLPGHPHLCRRVLSVPAVCLVPAMRCGTGILSVIFMARMAMPQMRSRASAWSSAMPEATSLKIGQVCKVSGGQLTAQLTVADGTLEHKGATHRIGQLGSYVTIPLDPSQRLVGFITGAGRQDSGSDAAGRSMLDIQLLGAICGDRFRRGIHRYPTIGDEVHLAVEEDFQSIFGTLQDSAAASGGVRSFNLGRFAMNPDFKVHVLGREFFSKHVAILGNSGSGKSCTTAKVIHESLNLPESQIVLFDLHGEYSTAFSDDAGQLNENVTYLGENDLILPYWLLRYEELEALFVDRNNPLNVSAQVSFLKTALQKLKAPAADQLGLMSVFSADSPIYFDLQKLLTAAQNFNEARYIVNSDQLALAKLALRSRPPKEQAEMLWEGRCDFNRGQAEGEVPHPLYFGKLLGLVNQIETRLNDHRYDFLLRPVKQAAASRHLTSALRASMTPVEFSGILSHMLKLLTGRLARRTNLTIVDLSGVPFDMVDVTVAVLTRLLFDFNFWTPPQQRKPVVLVYEEAHNYIPRQTGAVSFARAAVERVAKEGRKYGVSSVIVSQRPSELSETVLSQCNNMIVMRLNNPDDQHYVTKVVSDQFASMVSMLPILAPGEGFVIGDSVLMPLRTLIDLPPHTPRSSDSDVFAEWSTPGAPPIIDEILQHWWRQDRKMLRQAPDGQQPRASHIPPRTVHLMHN